MGGLAVKSVDRRGGGHRLADAADVEVVVVQGRTGQKRPRRERADDLWEVEGDAVRVVAVDAGDARHVARAGPARHVVLVEGAEAATRYQDLQPRLEGGGEHGIVPAERVADAADPPRVHFGERLQEIDGADV